VDLLVFLVSLKSFHLEAQILSSVFVVIFFKTI